MRSFMKIKPSQNGKITLSFTDVGESCPSCKFLTRQMSFNAIHENKILTKISEFKYVHREGSDEPAHMSHHSLYTQSMEEEESLDEILDI